MSDIRLVKIVTGDFVIGINDKTNNGIKEVANVQIVPSGTGSLSIALLPFGFPFEEEIGGFISNDKVIFEVKKIPAELEDKYVEAKSNIKIAKGNTPVDGKIIL